MHHDVVCAKGRSLDRADLQEQPLQEALKHGVHAHSSDITIVHPQQLIQECNAQMYPHFS